MLSALRVRTRSSFPPPQDLNERLKAYPASLNQSVSEWVCECADMTCMKPSEPSIEEYEMVRAEPTRFVVAPGAEQREPRNRARRPA